MKKILTLVLALCLAVAVFAGCSSTSEDPSQSPSTSENTDQTSQEPSDSPSESGTELSGVVKTGGSTSVEKVMNALIYQFQADNPGVTINYEMNGSGDGITNTQSGMYEIGHSSRDLKEDETGLVATPYAIDGIAVVVNKENTVSDLSKEQLFGIYTGTITNWSEVGGADAPITVVTREASSGTRGAFSEIIGLDVEGDDGSIDPATQIVSSATECKDTGSVQTTVSQNPNAIGYMSFSDMDTEMVTPVKYEGVEINTDTLKDDSYALKRNFLLITKEGATLSDAAQAFMDFVLSDAGQEVVASASLLPIN